MSLHPLIEEFQKKYPSKQEKEEALARMPDEEIDALIKACPNIYGKIFYSKFKKTKEKN